jgi:hypothetical protein
VKIEILRAGKTFDQSCEYLYQTQDLVRPEAECPLTKVSENVGLGRIGGILENFGVEKFFHKIFGSKSSDPGV